MGTQQAGAALDVGAVEELSERFAQLFRTFDVGDDVFSSDVFVDLNVPSWRFQLQGPEPFAAHFRELAENVDGEVRLNVLRTVPTRSGFVTEHEEFGDLAGQELMARRLWLCEVRDARIVEAVCYCTGEWDEALRARHALEAPMIRPWPLDQRRNRALGAAEL